MALYLYNFTLQKPAGITNAIFGNFSEPKAQEIVVSRGRILELLRPDENGKVQTILSLEVFGLIRSLRPFRLTGGTRDYIIVGSDSGRISILDYNAEHNRFDKIHEETFGRTGMRRVVPGQYLTTDPKGRAVMIGAIEKSKFVYVLNRDSAAKLTISSPLEAHKAHTITFDLVGVDVGFDNPLFAALEVDYEDMDDDATGEAIANAEKTITFYELDLGLNHVTRQSSEKCPMNANILISVPGTPDGPGGVLICCEGKIVHRTTQHVDHEAYIPRRRDVPRDRGILITSYALVKQRDWYFFLVQTENGDLFKVWLDSEGDEVKSVNVKYFDTVPLATCMSVLKTGFLFVAVEAGNHLLYQFQGIGDDEEDVTFLLENDDRSYFAPRALKNLVQIDDLAATLPITDLVVDNVCNEETPQVISACGNGPRSSLRILRQGIAVNERAVSALPGVPSAVWSIKTHSSDQFDRYIVLSFKDATMVLSIGETVEEVHDSGFLATAPTIHAAMVGDDALIQVHPDGLRHIRADKRVQEWKPPAGKKIRLATANLRQIALGLVGGEIIYFELDPSGQIVEVDKTALGKELVALGIAPVPDGRQRTRFLAVADIENKMRVYSLNPTDTLQSLAMQVLPARVSSLCLMEMAAFGGKALYANIGLFNGVLFRATIDRSSGQLSDTRARFLGARPVKLFPIKQGGEDGVLALSSRSWLLYNYQRKFTQNPISYTPLEYASGFRSEQCPEGIVSIAGDSLRIFTIETLGQLFNQTVIPLRYTPRKLLVHNPSKLVVVAEADADVFPAAELAKIRAGQKEEDSREGRLSVKMEVDGEIIEESSLPDEQYGVPRAGLNRWAACLRLVDVAHNKSLDVFELENNETVTCMCFAEFHNTQGETFLCVGTAKDLKFEPTRTSSNGYIHLYRIVENKIQFVHKTELGGIPGALCAFQGRLLIGVGSLLRIYDFGKKKMLRKCENKDMPNLIVSIWLAKDKIVVGDIQHSYHYGKYNRALNQIFFFADDIVPRWLTSGVQLDGTTIAGGDKFGNIFTLRLPEQVERMLAEDPSGGAVQWTNRQIIGAPHKLSQVTSFYVGETIAKVLKTTITPGGRECIFYATVLGTLGVLVPFQSREDVDFYTKLEMHMRQEWKSHVGRIHENYRSYYTPVKAVVDGDLCEQFVLLPSETQKRVAEDLDRTPAEVQKKLEDIRNSL